ncbi:MAG: hypothetical protein FWD13_05110 [Treponema sp.]|nr:hypothetical protein [Treponema sp.]
MTALALRKELQGYIAKMPERRLKVLKPLLLEMAEPLIVTKPANKREIAMIEKRVKEFPDNFVPFKKRVKT